jgi:hypothetical protein
MTMSASLGWQRGDLDTNHYPNKINKLLGSPHMN